MAVTVAASFAGTYSKSWNVTSSADADTAGTITHGFGVAPALVWAVPLLAGFYTKQWLIGAISTTTIILAAISATGGGVAGTPQLQVIAMLPHSIIS